MSAIEITRQDLSISQLRAEAGAMKNNKAMGTFIGNLKTMSSHLSATLGAATANIHAWNRAR